MIYHRPFQIMGFHSCDREIGLKLINGKDQIKLSNNPWDWLGEGAYFWEQNPGRALEYAIESAINIQFNKIPIKTPFVVGAIIELGNCLNLTESESIEVVSNTLKSLEKIYKEAGKKMPINDDNNRRLDCAVFKHLQKTAKENPVLDYDTIRSPFDEGQKIYEGANFTTRHHIQICVKNPERIRGYFLPMPLEKYNPYLNKEFDVEQTKQTYALSSITQTKFA